MNEGGRGWKTSLPQDTHGYVKCQLEICPISRLYLPKLNIDLQSVAHLVYEFSISENKFVDTN